MTPPNVLRPGIARPVEAVPARPIVPQARHRAERGDRDPDRRRPAPILDRWFESEELKATLATDAIIGAFAAPSMPGTAYVLFHHVMGETNGKRGVWGYVKGGMGGTDAGAGRGRQGPGRRDPLRRRGRDASSSADGAAAGVALANGEEFDAPQGGQQRRRRTVTFERLLDPKTAAAGLRRRRQAHRLRQRARSRSTSPCRSCRTSPPCPGTAAGPQHRGTIHICPDQDYIERAYDDAKYGRPSTRPDPRMHDAVGRSIRRVAPPGKHLMSMFIQYAPYKLQGGHLGRARTNAFADRCFDIARTSTRRTSSSSVHRPPGADAARPGADLRPDRRQHLPGRDDAQPAVLLPARSATRTTARRSAACTCAARRPIPAAASWAPPATTPPARCWGGAFAELAGAERRGGLGCAAAPPARSVLQEAGGSTGPPVGPVAGISTSVSTAWPLSWSRRRSPGGRSARRAADGRTAPPPMRTRSSVSALRNATRSLAVSASVDG